MKKIILCLFLSCICLFTACDYSLVGPNPGEVRKTYGLNEQFINKYQTCAFTLREVVVCQNVTFSGNEYVGKNDYMLMIKADVEFSDYEFTECGVILLHFPQDYYINDDGKSFYSLTDEDGDFNFSVSTALNPGLDLSGKKQTFNGTIYLCFDLRDEYYDYLLKESIEQSKPEAKIYDFNVRVFINDMVMENVRILEMGCYFKQVEFIGNYYING